MKHYNAITIHNEDEASPIQTSGALKPLAHDNDQHLFNPNPQDHLTPCFDCPHGDRPSTIFIGTFNLIASIIGGGVLSLPIVFSKCGVFFTTISMIFSAYITYMSLVMLCYSSRRRGGSSYGEVIRSAFGERMEEAVSWLLFIFLMFVIVGYMILIRDIWTPLVMLTPLASRMAVDNGDYVLLGVIVLLLPFLFQRSLHALRYNCYVGFTSVLILCIALGRGATRKMFVTNVHDKDDFEIEYFKVPTIQEALFSFPIVTCSFLCHFNVNSIQNALSQPTRQRMQDLLQYATVACCLLMYAIGFCGYLYAGGAVEGNILLNVPIGFNQEEDNEQIWLFTAGRIGIGVTITLAMPLMALPCRDSLLEIIDVWFHRSHHRSRPSAYNKAKEGQRCWNLFHTCIRSETILDAITTEDEVIEEEASPYDRVRDETRLLPRTSLIIRHDPIQRDYIFRNVCVHYFSTLLIITVCYIGAVLVRGVAYVWSFIGSSMAFFIAFILPCWSFIIIENEVPTIKDKGDRHEAWIKVAWVILVFSIVGAATCTVNSLL
ncbi:hypothetical protein HJC23_009361 [Cyclotella cryptica]|uniref:Amino acid transporter transmembrane domain-containing protein n=1 Tax=Cyclotella cryptica TaxID=29204 RepID=A0ABD3QSI9_9STRA|eukprot:CCRYP_002377-RF/>CCRYP_002377-RF protein AED:0.12 eAED:0.12 QI:188/1/0.93/1/0.26/0.18/16/4735/545